MTRATWPKLTTAQERILREAERSCAYEPTGPRIAACQRLCEVGLMRPMVSLKRFKVTADGRRWIERRNKEAS